MKNMLKKVISLSLVFVAATTMVACSNGAASEGNASTSNKAEKKEIVIWNAGIQTSDNSGQVATKDMPLYKAIDEFEAQNEGVKVTVVDYSMDDLLKSFTAANMAKKGPDMVALWAGSTTLGMQDYLLDLSTMLTAEEKAKFDVSALTHKNNDMNDELIGITFGMPATVVMYVNSQIFKDNGLEVPTTWEEMITVSDTLLQNGVTPLMVGDKDGYNSTWVINNFLANLMGPNAISNFGNGKELLSDANFTNSLNIWKEYVQAGYTNKDYLTKSDGDAIEAFIQGKAAMLIHGNWAITEFEAMGDTVDVAKVPTIAKGEEFENYISSQPNINIVIPSYSQNADITMELLKIIAGDEFRATTNEIFYSNETTIRLVDKTNALSDEGFNVTGFDSIVTGESANEFYKLVPTVIKGDLEIEEFTKKLDTLNK